MILARHYLTPCRSTPSLSAQTAPCSRRGREIAGFGSGVFPTAARWRRGRRLNSLIPSCSIHPGHTLATLGWQKSAGQTDGGDRHLRLWSLPEGHEVNPPAIDFGLRMMAAAFSPDGKKLARFPSPERNETRARRYSGTCEHARLDKCRSATLMGFTRSGSAATAKWCCF